MHWAVLSVLLLPCAIALAIDDEDNQEFLRKGIDTCPDVGYFFERTLIKQPNGSTTEQCYLCFCKEDNTASCWKRENKRCDFDSIYAMAPKPGRRRHKRSPWSLGNLFFVDAIKSLFNTNMMPEVCKPYEGSYSEGCPPADWCTGCTVCDCDQNGHWDCHVLSFCPDDGKKATPPPVSKRKNHSRRHLMDGPGLISSKRITTTKKPITRPTPKPKPKKPLPAALAHVPQQIVNSMPARWKKLLSNKKIYKPKNRNISKLNRKNAEKTKKLLHKVSPKYKENNMNFDLNTTRKPTQLMGSKRPKIETLLSRLDEKTKKIVYEYMKTLKKTNENKRIKQMKVIQNSFKTKPCTINPSKHDPITDILQSNVSKNSQNNKRIQRYAIKNMLIKTPSKPKRREVIPTKWTENEWKEWVRRSNRRSKREISDIRNFNQVNDVLAAKIDKVFYSSTPLINNIEILSKYKSLNKSFSNDYYKYYTVKYSNHTGKVDVKNNNSLVETGVGIFTTKNYINYTTDNEENYKRTVFELLDTSYNNTKHNNFNKSMNTKMKNVSKNSTVFENVTEAMTTIDNITVLSSKDNILNNTVIYLGVNKKKEKAFKKIAPYPKITESKIKIRKHNYGKINKTNLRIKNQIRRIFSNVVSKFITLNNSTRDFKQLRKNNFVFNYVKKFFHQLLFQRKGKKMAVNKQKKEVLLKKISIINILCTHYGPCKITKEKKLKLKPKIKELNEETRKIFTAIKIIKGLLVLISFKPREPNVIGYIRPDNILRQMNETEKLRAVLSGTYIDHIVDKPTTELTQVKHIKENTKTVVDSVSNFARILNEIIAILTSNGKDDEDILSRIQKKKRKPQDDSIITKIKNWLRKRNKYINKALESFENSENTTRERKDTEMHIKGKNTIRQNAVSIEQYTRKIIENLRSLQNLAKNKQPHQNRVKRLAVEEGDMYQYMLLLMEYLLKQKVHLERVPENDGIDLLIEAIRNAPDVKTIQNKISKFNRTLAENIKTHISRETTTVRVKFLKQNSASSEISKDDIVPLKHLKNNKTVSSTQNESYSYAKDSEVNILRNLKKKILENKEVDLQNIDKEDTYILSENNMKKKSSTVIKHSFKSDHDVSIKETSNDIEKAKEENESKTETSIDIEKLIESEKKNKNETSIDVEKMIESMSGEITDDVDLPFRTNKKTRSEEITTPRVIGTENTKSSSPVNWENVSTGANWDNDIEESPAARNVMKTKIPRKTATLTGSPASDDVSALSKEMSHKKPSNIEWLHLKLTPEELLHIKQMDMMNSLDYDIRRDDVELGQHHTEDVYF